jgi:predicted TIM-barrel fold metal-dependent hydrolase
MTIDVHHHILPDFYIEALARVGIMDGGGRPFPSWTAAGALDVMDRHGIATAVASISSPGVHFGDAGAARDLARRCNELLAELAAEHPGRFGGFAILPLPDVEGALLELEYALDTLGLDGIVMLSSVHGGHRPAAPQFAEVFQELERRKAVLFLHPDRLPQEIDEDALLPPYVVDFVYETTRAVAELIYSGRCSQSPNVTLILSHAGGTVPYIAWRLVQLEKSPKFKDNVPEGVMAHLKRFYYDTALSASRYPLRCLQELVGNDNILFGSDYVFVPEAVVTASLRRVNDYDGFDDEALAMVKHGNARRLFPRFQSAAPQEQAPAVPVSSQ